MYLVSCWWCFIYLNNWLDLESANRPRKGNDDAPVASSSAVQPAARSADLVGQVQKLGHYPGRFKEPQIEDQKAENNLAMKISKAWAELAEADRQTLMA